MPAARALQRAISSIQRRLPATRQPATMEQEWEELEEEVEPEPPSRSVSNWRRIWLRCRGLRFHMALAGNLMQYLYPPPSYRSPLFISRHRPSPPNRYMKLFSPEFKEQIKLAMPKQ